MAAFAPRPLVGELFGVNNETGMIVTPRTKNTQTQNPTNIPPHCVSNKNPRFIIARYLPFSVFLNDGFPSIKFCEAIFHSLIQQ